MLLTEEWCGYALKPKPLRVSSAQGVQRGTYRLQLPYKYGIPLLICSGMLHWLVSQSIFLVRIDVRDSMGAEIPLKSLSACGYSPIAIMFAIALGLMVVIVGIVTGFRKHKAAVPLAGSCSAVISAACHPPQGSIDTKLSSVKWTLIKGGSNDTDAAGLRHYSFT